MSSPPFGRISSRPAAVADPERNGNLSRDVGPRRPGIVGHLAVKRKISVLSVAPRNPVVLDQRGRERPDARLGMGPAQVMNAYAQVMSAYAQVMNGAVSVVEGYVSIGHDDAYIGRT